MSIEERKKDHVDLTAQGQAAYQKTTGFERFDFVHNPLPEVNFSEISTGVSFLGRNFDFPLFISSMTGGYSRAGAVNSIIASFCEKHNLPFGVGSQRVMLEKPETAETFSVVREYAPSAFIAANIGGCQLIDGLTDKEINLLIDSIKSNACVVHLNPLQELMQPEGDRNFKGILKGIKELVNSVSVPVIVKETGAGIPGDTAEMLADLGVAAIDVSGAGGTSWSKVENLRSGKKISGFDEWGIPTVDCLTDVRSKINGRIPIIASGGIRDSFDIAKSLCLGADMAASAQPVIKAIIESGESGLEKWYEELVLNLKRIMCLLGVSKCNKLMEEHLRERY